LYVKAIPIAIERLGKFFYRLFWSGVFEFEIYIQIDPIFRHDLSPGGEAERQGRHAGLLVLKMQIDKVIRGRVHSIKAASETAPSAHAAAKREVGPAFGLPFSPLLAGATPEVPSGNSSVINGIQMAGTSGNLTRYQIQNGFQWRIVDLKRDSALYALVHNNVFPGLPLDLPYDLPHLHVPHIERHQIPMRPHGGPGSINENGARQQRQGAHESSSSYHSSCFPFFAFIVRPAECYCLSSPIHAQIPRDVRQYSFQCEVLI
jgi:hypothetical protein